MISYWERESFIHYDIIIIGSGIVGLSTAISIKEKYPGRSVLILERGILPAGASTRNAGFTTFGGVGELLSDLNRLPKEDVVNQVIKRWEGLRMLRDRLGDERIGYQNHGGYEFVFNNETIGPAEVEKINGLLFPVFKSNAFSMENSAIDKFHFNKNFIKHCIYTPFEGQLHTGKMMRALHALAQQLGVEIKTGAEVSRYDVAPDKVRVTVLNAVMKSEIEFSGTQLILCTNAFTKTFFPEFDIIPGRGQVLVTKPLKKLPFKGIFHFDEGYFYFRDIDDRVLFGGGRNLDFEGEKTDSFELNRMIQQKLDYYLKNLVLPKVDYEVDLRWSGIMAFGKEKVPIVKRVNERVLVGVRMNGIGVAIGTKVGAELAEMI